MADPNPKVLNNFPGFESFLFLRGSGFKNSQFEKMPKKEEETKYQITIQQSTV